MFTNIVRQPLNIRNAHVTELQLLFIISQFPLLEDLTILSPTATNSHLGYPFPEIITQSPPLRGTLALVRENSVDLCYGLGRLPGGLECRSLELFRCRNPQSVLDSCRRSVTSLSYSLSYSPVSTTAINLRRCGVLERIELTIEIYNVSKVREWIPQTLGTITTPLFNEFVIWILRQIVRGIR